MSVPVRPHMVPTTASSPIGSSPAVCYTQYLPPESKADILLLDCGDPRSILYTIHCRSSLNFDPAFPILDFTCSDTNPVVLARNILLLTLIADNTSGKDTQKIWNSFYHIYLDGASCNLIHAQAAKLHKMSWTIKQWNDGEYGYFIRFVNVDTMSKLRDYWDHWANVKNMSKAQKKRFKDKYQCGTNETSASISKLSNSRVYPASAGLFWETSEAPLKALLESYWKTGVTSSDKKLVEVSSLPNPTLAYTSNGQVEFVGRSITHPAWGYHMSEAYTRTRGSLRDTEPDPLEVAIAKAQFTQWGECFRRALDGSRKGGKLVIRFALSDAGAICYALANCFNITAGDYLAQWESSAFFLDSGDYEDRGTSAPIKFDVIDTATISDSIGELTVLSFTQPLLAQTVTATLRMSEKLKFTNNEHQPALQDWNLGLDPYILGLLLGILPIGLASGFSTIPNIDEKNFASAVYQDGKQAIGLYETKVWKWLPFQNCSSLAMDEQVMAAFLYSLFRRMCSMHKERIGLPGYNARKVQSNPHRRVYSPSIFAQLIRPMLMRTEVDSRITLDLLIQIIRTDQSIHDKELTCELVSQLHIYELRKFEDAKLFSGRLENKAYSRLGEWCDVPDLVCVTFAIPAEASNLLNDISPDDTYTTCFTVEVEADGEIYLFTSFHSLYASPTNLDFAGVELTELHVNDRDGSPLMLTFWMPSEIIATRDSDDTWIRLMIDEASASEALRKAIDNELCIFETTVSNRHAVLISTERPNTYRDLHQKINQFRRASKQVPEIIEPHRHAKTPVNIELDHLLTLKAFSFRWNSPPEIASDPLIFDMDFLIAHPGQAALVNDTAAEDMDPLYFPLPIRKIIPHPECSHEQPWFLAIPSRPARFDEEFWVDHFPARFCDPPHIASWNLHYIMLDSMPAVDAVLTDSLTGLRLHYCSPYFTADVSFTDGTLKSSAKPSGYRDFKFNIWTIFESYLGFQGPACSIFCFSNEEKSKTLLVLFVTDLRLDLTTSALVLDCCVLPVTANIEDRIGQFLQEQVRKGERILCRTLTSGAVKAWADFIPPAAERCRTWCHGKGCDLSNARSDFPDLTDDDLLCECAQGQPSSSFRKNQSWHLAFGNHVTRVAVSVLFDEDIRKPQCHISMATQQKFSTGDPVTPTDYFGNGWDNLVSTCKVCGAACDPSVFQGQNGELFYCSLECEEEDPDREGQIPLLNGPGLSGMPGLDAGATKKKKKNKKKKKKKAKASDNPEDGEEADNEEGGPLDRVTIEEVRGIIDN